MSQLRTISCFSLRSQLASPRSLCSDVGCAWGDKELDQKLVNKHQGKAQVRVRPDLAFPCRLVLTSSHLWDWLHDVGPCAK